MHNSYTAMCLPAVCEVAFFRKLSVERLKSGASKRMAGTGRGAAIDA